MRIGVLETGEVLTDLVDRHGPYIDHFKRLLNAVDPDLTFVNYAVVKGHIPDDPTDMDAWIITGSRHGVYDDLPWIEPLKTFLRTCLAAPVKVVGICFGHQILAEAMGGKVVKSDRGWGLGVHSYRESGPRPAWMSDVPTTWSGHAVHQDQVVIQPPGSTILSGSDFCEYAALVYGDAEAPVAISVQPHPEFTAEFVNGLIEARLGEIVSEDVVGPGQKSLGKPVDNTAWAKAIVAFLHQGQSI